MYTIIELWRSEKCYEMKGIVIDFSKINAWGVLLSAFFVSYIIGKLNSTPLYNTLNSLPEDRNELSPIKKVDVFITDQNILDVVVSYEAVLPITIRNIKNAIRVEIKSGPAVELYKDVLFSNVDDNGSNITFRAHLDFYGTVTARVFFYNTPLTEEIFLQSSIRYIYPGHSYGNFNIDKGTSYQISKVCYINNQFDVYFIKGAQIPPINVGSTIHFNNILSAINPNASIINQEAVILAASSSNKWDLIRDVLSKAYQKMLPTYVLKHEDFVSFNPPMNVLTNGTCFDKVNFGLPFDNFNAYRKHILDPDTKYDAVLFGSSYEPVLKAFCPECTFYISNSTNKDEFIRYAKHAKYVVGRHSDAFLYAIPAVSENATIIDIMPSSFKCASWVSRAANDSKKKVIVVEEKGDAAIFCNSDDCNDQACQNYLKKDNNGMYDIDMIVEAGKSQIPKECSPYFVSVESRNGKIHYLCNEVLK